MPVYNRPDTITKLVDVGAKRVFMSWEEINAPYLFKNIREEHR